VRVRARAVVGVGGALRRRSGRVRTRGAVELAERRAGARAVLGLRDRHGGGVVAGLDFAGAAEAVERGVGPARAARG